MDDGRSSACSIKVVNYGITYLLNLKRYNHSDPSNINLEVICCSLYFNLSCLSSECDSLFLRVHLHFVLFPVLIFILLVAASFDGRLPTLAAIRCISLYIIVLLCDLLGK